MRANPGDWIIRGVKGEFYPCKPDIFEATYSVAQPASADAWPTCPECSVGVLYECPACSATNYPPPEAPRPAAGRPGWLNNEGCGTTAYQAQQPAAAGELPEAVPSAHVMVNKFGTMVNVRFNTGFGYNFTVADFIDADKRMPDGAPHTGKLLYDADQIRAAVAGLEYNLAVMGAVLEGEVKRCMELGQRAEKAESAVAGYRRDAELEILRNVRDAIERALSGACIDQDKRPSVYKEGFCAGLSNARAIVSGRLDAALANLGSGDGKEGQS